MRSIWSRVNLVSMAVIRLAIIVGAFVFCYQSAGLLVALVASVALVVLLGPTVIVLSSVAATRSGEPPRRLVQTVYRVQLPVALALLLTSIPTKLPGLIILCVLSTLMAAMTSLMMWAARQSD